VPGQQATGVFMTLETPAPVTLVGVHSPLAGRAEVHEMKMAGSVMKMRPVPRLPLQVGQATTLQPGGLHIMLMELKTPLVAGQRVSLSLVVENDQGVRQEYAVEAEVRPLNAPPPATSPQKTQGRP
jgi:copper(I)-binding protein